MIQSIRMLEELNYNKSEKVNNVTHSSNPNKTDNFNPSPKPSVSFSSDPCILSSSASGTIPLASVQNLGVNPKSCPKRILIIGDSHCRNLKDLLSKELPSPFHVSVNFKPGGTFHDVAKLCVTSDPPYEHVIVIAGTNDVCRSTWSSVENAVYDISETFRHSKVHLVLTPPRANYTPMNKYINTFNYHLREISKKLNNVQYIETQFLFHFNDYAFDNLHLNRSGKIKLCRTLRHAIVNKHATVGGRQRVKTNPVNVRNSTDSYKTRQRDHSHKYHPSSSYYQQFKSSHLQSRGSRHFSRGSLWFRNSTSQYNRDHIQSRTGPDTEQSTRIFKEDRQWRQCPRQLNRHTHQRVDDRFRSRERHAQRFDI
uniref:Uncharacterized protein n=1 Tax=Cacopsylla melanoneura TaxID=428564 RepID=A0A8D8ZYY7_9HEMI